MKKILVLCTTDSMIWNFLVPHIKYWNKRGCSVECASSETGFYFNELKKIYNFKMFKLPIKRSPFKIDNLRSYFYLKQIVEERKYDLIVCQEPVGGVLGRIVGHVTKTKVVYTAHGFHFFSGAPKKNWLLYYPVEKFLSRWTDILLTSNQEDYKRAQKFHCKIVDKINGIGIDLEQFNVPDFNADDEKKKLGLPEEAKIVFNAAELIPRKNHETALKAFAQIKDNNLFFVICGVGELENKLKSMTKKLQIEERVFFLGFRKDWARVCKISDVFLFTSFQEGLSVSLLGAMAAGLPVVCSDIRGNRDVIEEEKGGYLVAPDDIDGFAEALYKVIYDKNNKMGLFNQNIVKKYDVPFSCAKMFEILQKV